MRLAWRLSLPLTLTLSPRALGIAVDRLSPVGGPRTGGEREPFAPVCASLTAPEESTP
jgi:hypothetical protein